MQDEQGDLPQAVELTEAGLTVAAEPHAYALEPAEE
jgi:hypothetical protein